jgi:hypothetical protein
VSEWWTYTLDDFLLFSPATYWRLFELHNRGVWPAQLPALAAGVTILALTWGRSVRYGRLAGALLAACWLWVAWAFHWHRYTSINWAASWFAVAFALEGLLLAWRGVVHGRIAFDGPGTGTRRAGVALLVFALIGIPLAAPLSGRPWAQAELFGTAPDPTAIATLGVLLAARGRARWGLMVVPLAWCVVSAATLYAMRSWGGILCVSAVLLAMLFAWTKRHEAPRGTAA